MFSDVKYLVIGAGFSGAVIAERIASQLHEKVLVIDRRKHIGGTSYSEVDPETGVECHRFGSHIFHTSLQDVWDYILQFTSFNTYQHKVLITVGKKVFQMPINLKTINEFYGINLRPYEVQGFIEQESKRAGEANSKGITNLEEKAISLIGEKLYSAFIKGYTQKQWNCSPRLLPAEIITRLPVRKNFNANYFNDTYQGIPLDGYGKLFERILKHRNIEVKLGVDFSEIRNLLSADCTIFYSGRLDELCNYQYGELGYRSLKFEWQNHSVQDWQGTSVMNYGDECVPYTRIHEFKHYHPERTEIFQSGHTTICFEYPQSYTRGLEAYYPVDTPDNRTRYQAYRDMLCNTKIIPIGRLGAYKYWDMDKAIKNSLDVFNAYEKELAK